MINVRSEIEWCDLLIGIGATVVISILLVGFHFQTVPEYTVGAIATQDVRAPKQMTYEDPEATALKREAARASVPAFYDLDTTGILSKEGVISKTFAEARDLLAQKRLPSAGSLGASQQSTIVQELAKNLGDTLPPDILHILLRQRFSTALEERILNVLDTVLRDGIIRDADFRAQFLKHQRTGIVVRNNSTLGFAPLTEVHMVRNLSAAREYLRQFHLEFAALPSQDRATLIQFLETQLFQTLRYNEGETIKGRDAAANQVPTVEIPIKQGKIIVRTGEEITQSMVSQLEALKKQQKPNSAFRQFLGFFYFAAVLVYGLWRYFVHYQSRHRKIRNHTLLILLVITTVLVLMRLITELADIVGERLSIEALGNHFLLDYAIPFAFGSVLVTLLVDTNLGILTAVIIATLSGLFYADIYLTAYVFIGSLAGIYSIKQYKDRAAIQKVGLTIGVVNTLCMFGIDTLRQVPFTYSGALSKCAFALMSGILTSAFASMLLPALEWLFKIITDIRLLELSNLNAPILRRLSVEAPGTYHHSLMVGTLGEAAAEAIGANPLLARVGAYYHDLGKILKPEYFVENQVFGINKHEYLSPSMSCLIIASHVKDGLELAKEIGLAEKIRDLIPQHHGTRVMTYFFQKAKDSPAAKNQDVEEVDFRYPGPKPQSKEAAIMMMADAIEAASRTLTNPTAAQIQGMINRLVDAIVADDQFDECDITLRDICLVKESFLKILTGLYHRRIDYPGYDFQESVSESEKSSIQDSSAKPAKAF